MLLPMPFAGDTFAGSRDPISGSVKNFRVRVTDYASAQADFAPVVDNPNSHRVAVLLNGAMTSRQAATTRFAGLASLAEGTHTVDARVLEIGEAVPNYHGDDQGQRAWLEWDRCEDPTCRSYKVYWDEGAGGTPDVLLETVTQIVIPDRLNMRGGEIGRINVFGGYTGLDPMNDVVTFTLADTGQWDFTCATGTGEGTFEIGQTLALPYGIWIEILDDLDAYGTLSTFEIPVGPGTSFLSAVLDPSDYQFAVTALDEAGNETAVSEARKIRIYNIPPELPGKYQEWDQGTETMTVGWDPVMAAGLGIVTVNIYANHADEVGGLAEHIITDMPWRSVPVGDGSVELARADTTDGLIQMYLRPVNAAGEERRSVAIVEFTMPAKAVDMGLTLGEPVTLQVTPSAGGALDVAWDYGFDEERDDLEGFEVAVSSTSDGQTWAGVLDLTDDDGAGFPTSRFTMHLAGPFTGTQYVKVRAYTAGQTVWRESDEVSAVADSTAPAYSGELRGVSQ